MSTLDEGWADQNNSPQHKRASVYNIPEDYFLFSVVRNPYDRIISEYYWRQRLFGLNQSLNQFVKHFTKTYNDPRWDNHGMPQSWFLDRNFITVFKYEQLNTLWKVLRDITGYNIPDSIPKTYDHSLLSKASKKYIQTLYDEDFARFNYNV